MKNILFDLYGTLIDIHTNEESDSFWETFAKKTKAYYPFSGPALKQAYSKICAQLQEQIEELDILKVFTKLFKVESADARKIAVLFRKLSTEYIKLYPGVKSLLKTLIKRGYRLYVLSNAQEAFTIPELKSLGIYKQFTDIAISSDYGVKKPNLQFFKQAMQNFNLEISDTIMVGNDYLCDICPANELGLKTIFIQSNLTPKHATHLFLLGFNKRILLERIEQQTKQEEI